MKTIIAALGMSVMCGTAALASGNVQKWQGTGAVYTPAGVQLETYDVSVVNTEISAQVIQSDATVTAADGSQKVISQKLTLNGDSWSVESNLGKGGGACYGEGLCENYISSDDGSQAYATTIISDGADSKRQITTVLQNGKAVKMLRQKRARVQ